MTITPTNVKQARLDANLTQRQAAELIYCTERQWRNYEMGVTGLPRGLWELFCIKTKGGI
jgi:hypothetical protein